MKTLNFGTTTIDRVVECETYWVDPNWLYPNIDRETLKRHAPSLGARLIHPQTLQLGLSFHSYVIRTPHLNILVDTCNGNHKPRGPKAAFADMLASDMYLTNLNRLGLRPEDIDIVLCTHLHVDHVGWNTRLIDGRWVPTFPNARYLMARQEVEYFTRLYEARPAYPVNHGSWEDSVMPVIAAGRADIVDMNHVVQGHIDDGVWMEPAIGHTPGHVTIHIKERGHDAILSGDIIHHPVWIAEPRLEMFADWDRDKALQARRRLVERCADTSTYLLTAHFPTPTAGHVCSHGGRFSFRFVSE